jgi:hypothetical protein
MWGTSFPDGKLTVDFGNEFGAPFIGDRSNFCFLTKKSVPNNFAFATVSATSRNVATSLLDEKLRK